MISVREQELAGLMKEPCCISFVMSRYMHESGMTADHFGKIAVTGRYHASLNPNAYLRKPITIEDYKKSRMISDPIRLFDCVMPANGGKAYIMTSAERAKSMRKPPVYLKDGDVVECSVERIGTLRNRVRLR